MKELARNCQQKIVVRETGQGTFDQWLVRKWKNAQRGYKCTKTYATSTEDTEHSPIPPEQLPLQIYKSAVLAAQGKTAANQQACKPEVEGGRKVLPCEQYWIYPALLGPEYPHCKRNHADQLEWLVHLLLGADISENLVARINFSPPVKVRPKKTSVLNFIY